MSFNNSLAKEVMPSREILQANLQNYITLNNVSQAKVSKAIGKNQTCINQWLNNKYPGDNENLDELVYTFLKRLSEVDDEELSFIPFRNISTASKVFETAKACQLKGKIGVVTGNAGCGKTYAVKEYARQNKDVILLEVDLTFTAKVTLTELHNKIGLAGAGSIHDMFEDIVYQLKGSRRLIIIDEAEYLPFKALELVRRINDRTQVESEQKRGVGILLVGLPRLEYNLKGYKGEYAQLHSRAGIVTRLEKFSQDDTEEVVNSIFPGSNGLWKEFYKHSLGNGRNLEMLILRSNELAKLNNTKVNEDIVSMASKSLLK